MIHLFRRIAKSMPAKILLSLLIASFAIWGIGDIFTSRGDSAVASVGDQEVSSVRFADALNRTQRALSQQQRRAVTLSDMVQAGLADATLAGLVRDAAFQEELHRLGVAVPAESVRQAIASNPSFQDGQGAFNAYLYKTRLSQAGYSPPEFEAATRELLGQQLVTDAFTPAIVAPPGVAEAIAAHNGEKRTIAVVRLTPDMAAEPASPDDATLQAYYDANKEQFREPERRTGFYLHTDLDKLAAELTPTEEEVRAEYEAHPENYATVASREVEQIVFDDMETAKAALDRIRAGSASFAEIAAEQNVNATDLSIGRVTEGDLPPASSEAVFGVAEPGVVGPVEGAFGPILYNVTSIRPGGTAPFDEVKAKISADMAARKAREAVIDRANRIDDLRAAGTPLPEIAKETGVELVRFTGMDAKGNVAEGTPPPLVSDPAFLAEVNMAVDGEERDMIQLSDGSYALVMIEKITDSQIPELADIRDKVAEAWSVEQRLEALDARATTLAGQVAPAGGLAELAVAEKLPEPESFTFTRETVPPGLSPILAEAVFAAQPGDPLVGRTTDGSAVLLGVLKEVTPLPPDALAEQTGKLNDALVGSISQDQLDYLGRAVEAKQGVEVNQGAVQRVYSRLGYSAQR